MELHTFGKKWSILTLSLVLSGISFSLVRAENALTADEIISKAVARSQDSQVRERPASYSYTKLTLTEELDAAGNIKDRKERMYQVMLQAGATRLKLISVNGRPPTEAELKLQSDNETNARRLLGPAKSGKGENRENFLTPDLVAHYSFKLNGQVDLNGRPAYEIAFAPKNPDAPIHHLADRLLNRISGTICIDVQEYEIAKAEVRLGSEVTLLGGVIGSLRKMAYTITRTRLPDGIWLNTSSVGDFEGRKLIDSLRIKTKSHSSNFRVMMLPS